MDSYEYIRLEADMNVDAAAIAEVLGGPVVLGRPVTSMRGLEEMVRAGIPKPALDRLIGILASSLATGGSDARRLRNRIVPRATYQRVERFNLQVSETTERIARLYAMMQSAFRDPEAAARFMMRPHPELDGRAPFDAALTEVGGREVEEIIDRGLHGLPV